MTWKWMLEQSMCKSSPFIVRSPPEVGISLISQEQQSWGWFMLPPLLNLLKVGCFGSQCLRGVQSFTQPPRRGRASPEEPAGGWEDARSEADPQCAGLPDDPCAAHAGKVGSPVMSTFSCSRDGVLTCIVRPSPIRSIRWINDCV